RFARSLFEHAALGSAAYVSGEKGNPYTQYLERRFDKWTPEEDTWATHILTDASSPESPWNPSYVPGTESLFAVGLPITNENRAASTNPYVMKLPMWQRKTAIPAVAKYVSEIAKSQYPGADQMVLDAAIGRLAPAVSNEEVESLFAIQLASNGTEVSVANVQALASVISDPRSTVRDAGTGYKILRSTYGAVSRAGRAHAIVDVTGGGAGGTLPLTPGQIPLPSNLYDQTGAQQVDVTINPLNRGLSDTVHHMSVTAPGGAGSSPPDVRLVGGGLSSGGAQAPGVIRADVTGTGGGAPGVNAHDVAGHIDRQLPSLSSNLNHAVNLVIDMCAAGFRETDMQNPAIAQVAHQIHSQDPQKLTHVAIAARALGPNDINMGAIDTIEKMIESGWNANQIERPAIWTAQALMNDPNHFYPSPSNVRVAWSHSQYQPTPNTSLSGSVVEALRKAEEKRHKRELGLE
ncbi:MAG: hypothetical protein HY711_11100, partial [Candidatus Melainabacteria bacterium]|nr:hypothetical protein [Candidatus Melainabacteria bacterium]